MAEKDKINYQQFTIISIIAFVIYLSNQMVSTTISKYANSMQATPQIIGLIVGVFGVMALFTRPFAGQVVDKKNNKVLMFMCISILLLSNICLIIAKNEFYLLLSRAFNGFGWGFGSTLCVTTACNALPKENMASGIAIYSLAQTLAQVLGPYLAVKIIELLSYKNLYYITTVLMMVAFMLTFIFKTDMKGKKDTKYSLSIKEMFAFDVIIPALISVSNSMENAAVTAFILLYADSLGVKNVSYFFSLQAFTILAVRPLMSKIVTNRNINSVIVISEIIIIAGLVNLFFAKSLIYFIFSAILFGIGRAGSQPYIISLCVNLVSTDERGKATNTNYAGYDIGQFMGANFAGFIAERFGYKYIFLFVTMPMIMALFIFVRTYMVPGLRKTQRGM